MCNKILFLIFLTTTAVAQAPKNWQLLDYEKDHYYGISVQKAVTELLHGKKPKKKIIVAVIDMGIDVNHPALKDAIWSNVREIPGNRKDDDANGYIDDIHGWNFMGSLQVETYDYIREYLRYRDKFENTSDTLDPKYDYWLKMKQQTQNDIAQWKTIYDRNASNAGWLFTLSDYWSKKLKKDTVYFKEVSHLKIPDGEDAAAKMAQEKVMPLLLARDTVFLNPYGLSALAAYYQKGVAFTKGDYDTAKSMIDNNDVGLYRKVSPGDDPESNSDIYYGNGNVMADIPHGTGCAGIISFVANSPYAAGKRKWVEIMAIKAVAPKVIGAERDKDIANSIRYAVDNGAKVINISLGKDTSPHKDWTDDAVKYAEKKGVLITVAAGNMAQDLDPVTDYPSQYFADGTKATNMIKAGATTSSKDLIWPYSNYGPKETDVFAPGDKIYTTALNGEYYTDSGSSFAAPHVAGLAALIWTYYPELSMLQVKKCIEQSVQYTEKIVLKPGTDQKVLFKSLSNAGGLINAYRALMIASKM